MSDGLTDHENYAFCIHLEFNYVPSSTSMIEYVGNIQKTKTTKKPSFNSI